MNKGMSLIEVMIALSILAFLVLGIGTAFVSSAALRKNTEEQITAANVAETQMEQIRSRMKRTTAVGSTTYTNLDSIIAFYSQSANQTFTNDNLPNCTGTITLYLNEAQVPVELDATSTTFTNADGESFGPLELDGDASGDAGYESEDHSSPSGGKYSANMLPVEVSLTWQSKGGAQVTMRKFGLIGRTDD